ncbi:RNAPII degradation factor [Microsporum audouinii]
MSEVQSRPSASRGRGSARGGRGGHISRGRGGARSTAKPASQDTADQTASYEDEGEIGQLKKKHAGSLSTIKELFADWTDEDLVFALEDANGDLEVAIERITEGTVSQWGEVKKKSTDRTRQKASSKDATQPVSGEQNIPPPRAGRGRGGFDQRGRGRGDRGRAGRGGRAGSHAVQPSQTNGTHQHSTPTADAWDSSAVEPSAPVDAPAIETKPQPEWNTSQEIPKTAVDQSQKTSLIPEGSKRGWASLFAKPAPEPVKEPPLPTAPSAPEKLAEAPVELSIPETPAAVPEPEPLPTEEQEEQQPEQQPPPPPPQPVSKPVEQPKPVIPQQPPPPSVSVPVEPETPAQPDTEALTDIEKESVPQQKQQPQARTPATSYAYPKGSATGSARGPNFQRRVMDQQEAVVMPGNLAVDRAAVQFGSMGLNGSVDDVNIDEEREEPETRPQPPQHSPVAPRASLPPSTRPMAVPEPTATAPRPAPGLPPAPVASADTPFNDFSRYGETQKQYDIFNQADQQAQPQSQEPFSNQGMPSQPAAVTTAADYSTFYGADQSRNPYYYSSYGQPQDPAANQRAAAGFAASGAESQPQVPASQPPGRYAHAEAPNSGQNTPQPVVPGQVQSAQQPSHHMPQTQGAHAGFNYGYPYYSNPHYPNAYMNQMTQHQQHQYGRNRPMYDDARRYEEQQQQQQQQQQHYLPHQSQFAYGNQYAPYGKGGMYNQQPQQHGFGYESSPANTAAFNQSAPQRDSATYGRAGSAQPADGQQQQSTGANAFGGIPDVFGRTQSGFGQNQPIPSQQPTSADETGSAKAYDSSKAGGPSPSVSHVNRPGSAANNAPHQPATTGQSGLPPVPAAQQANQQAFGGYPHLNQQYSGLGGLGAHQAGTTQSHHQATAYNNYGAGFGSNYYGNNGRGGGWGGNYGH